MMSAHRSDKHSLAATADALIARMRSRPSAETLTECRNLLAELRDAREFQRLGALAEEIDRQFPGDALSRKFYAQSLIDTGKASLALNLLEATLNRLSPDHEQFDELQGLVGRAYKQIFMDAADTSTPEARRAIENAISAYRESYRRQPEQNYWHGINLSAVLHAGRKRGLRAFQELDAQVIAREVLERLNHVPLNKRNSWWSATQAEAHIALGHWAAAEEAIHNYVTDGQIPPFNIASTLRQLRDVWEIQKDSPQGMGLLQTLEACLAQKSDGLLEVRPEHIRTMRAAMPPSPEQRERVLGTTDAQPIQWYRTMLDRAASVAAIRVPFGQGVGTGFAIRAGDFGIEPANELLVLTNYHVVNKLGRSGAERPEDVEVIFEAAGPSAQEPLPPYSICEIVVESSFEELDYAVLRLDGDLSGVASIPITRSLPVLASQPHVYVIGHPYGKELHISLQDSHLLDHEGPPEGTPPNPNRRRLHYHTPTSQGHSGSPVFDRAWRGIALHHTGGKHDPKNSLYGIRHLNGKSGLYSANEGLWIGSIVDAIIAQEIVLKAS